MADALDPAPPLEVGACRAGDIVSTGQVRGERGAEGATSIVRIDPLGRRADAELDALGWPRAHSSPGRGTTRVEGLSFDAVARTTEGVAVGPVAGAGERTRIVTDAAGRLLVSDPIGAPWAQVRSSYAGLLRTTTRVADPTDTTAQLDGPGGEPWARTRGAEVERWDYDPVGRPTRHASATGEVRAWRYDASGREVEARVAGGVTRTTAFWRGTALPTLRELPAGEIEALDYDSAGRTTRHQVGGGAEATWTYDDSVPGEAHVLEARGDAEAERVWTRGWLTRVAHGPRTVTLGYTADGRVDAAWARDQAGGESLIRGFDYDDAGRETRQTANGRTVRAATYDALGRATESTESTKASSGPATAMAPMAARGAIWAGPW